MFMDYEEFASLQLDKPIPDIRVSNIMCTLFIFISFKVEHF